MDLMEIGKNPHLIAAMTTAELQEAVTGLADHLEQVTGILRMIAERITTEPVQPLAPRHAASAHYEPLKKIVKLLRERGASRKVTEDWLRDLVIHESIPHRIDAMGRMVMRWRDFVVWEKRWWRKVEP